jgi:alpha-ketoglutarate-dependent taurine dioxygenase
VDISGFSPARLPSLQQRHREDTGHDWDSCGEPSHFTPSGNTDEQKPNPHPINPAIVLFIKYIFTEPWQTVSTVTCPSDRSSNPWAQSAQAYARLESTVKQLIRQLA